MRVIGVETLQRRWQNSDDLPRAVLGQLVALVAGLEGNGVLGLHKIPPALWAQLTSLTSCSLLEAKRVLSRFGTATR